MAVLALAAGGAALGGALGSALGAASLGVSLGWALGGLAGNLLFGPRPPAITGPRLGDLAVQTATYGAAIPLVFGTARVAGNIIWSAGIREQATTQRVRAGKGGRRQSVTTYAYFASWASALCAGPIAGVLRLWFDDKLVYDATGGSLQLQLPGLRWRFHPGDEAQLPDPLIEAEAGPGNAVAHRGLCYLVFEDIPLDAFGNRIPSVSAEIASGGEAFALDTPITLPPAQSYDGRIAAVDFERARRLLVGSDSPAGPRFLAAADLIAATAERLPIPSSPSIHAVAADDGKVYLVAGGSGSLCTPLHKFDADTGVLLGSFGEEEIAVSSTRSRFRWPGAGDAVLARVLTPFGFRRFLLTLPLGRPVPVYCIDLDNLAYVFGSEAADDQRLFEAAPDGRLEAGAIRETGTDVWYLAAPGGGGLELWRIVLTAAAQGGPRVLGVTAQRTATWTNDALGLPAGTVSIIEFAFDRDDETVILGGRVGANTDLPLVKARTDGAILWRRLFTSSTRETRSGQRRILAGTYALALDGQTQVLLDTRTGETLQTVTPLGHATFPAFAYDGSLLASFFFATGGYRRLVFQRRSGAGMPLGEIVAALCARAGLAPGEINAAGLTDSVRGFVLARPMPARQAIEPLAAAFAFDAVERDDVLTFVRRGGAPAATLDHAELVRRGEAPVIEEQRAQDAELPRALSVRHIDPGRAYEIGTQRWQRPRAPTPTMASVGETTLDLPIVLTASEAKAVARRLVLAAWRERTRFSFAASTRHLRLEPADVATLVRADGTQSRVRLISAQLGADWTLAIEAVQEAPGEHALAALADGGAGFAPDTLPLPYATRGFALNLPLLADADDLAGTALRSYLLAGGMRGQAWRRAEVFRSADGIAWEPAGALLDVAAWGGLAAPVPVPASYWTWDDATLLTVQMQSGAERIEGATDLDVLNGANLAALAAEDSRVELVQFAHATPLGNARFELRRLLRGRRGTEDAGAFASGAVFLLLDGSLLRGASPLGALNTVERFRFVGLFQSLQTATEHRRLMLGRAEQPYAPVRIQGSRTGAGDLTITWLRRSRIGGELVDLTGALPLGEAAELYEVDVRDAADTVTLRSFTGLASPTVTYTAAQQAEDGLVPGEPVRLHVHQISAVAGRGRRGEAIV